MHRLDIARIRDAADEVGRRQAVGMTDLVEGGVGGGPAPPQELVQVGVDRRGDHKGERKEVTSLVMQYVPMHWECSFPKDRIFAEFLTLIRKNPGKKIFVHCRVGDDRTGMMIAAYRMAEEGWSPKQAMREMTEYGFNLPHRRLICPRLSEYEEHFPERFATKPEFEELRSTKPSQLPESPAASQPEPPATQEPPSQPPL